MALINFSSHTGHIWGNYSIVTWVKTFKGKFDMTLTGPYP